MVWFLNEVTTASSKSSEEGQGRASSSLAIRGTSAKGHLWMNFLEPLSCYSERLCPDLALIPDHFSSTPSPSDFLILQFSSLDHLELNTFNGTQIKRLHYSKKIFFFKKRWDCSTRFPSIILVHSHHSRGLWGRHYTSYLLAKETEARSPDAPQQRSRKTPTR